MPDPRYVAVKVDDERVDELYIEEWGRHNMGSGPNPTGYAISVPPDGQVMRREDAIRAVSSLEWEAASLRFREQREHADVLDATARRLSAAFGLDEEEP